MTRPRPGWRLLIPVFALALAVSGTAVAQPTATGFDYTAVEGLSQPDHDTQREVVQLEAHDGVQLYLEVTRPTTEGRFPVILEASPYHGTLHNREGTRIFPGPGLTSYFAPRGYAVVMMDLRGTGRSQGCLDHLGPDDAKDLKRVIEWAADQEWSNGRVGMTGHSYVGSSPSLAASTGARGLVTIVPSAGLATMYHHQFQHGVPFFLQYAGTMFAYAQLATERYVGDNSAGLVGDGVGRAEAACTFATSSLTAGSGQVTGQYEWWHAARDWRAGAIASDVSVFMVHGVNDQAARVVGMRWFTDRGGRPGDKLWLGQWDHGSNVHPNRRGPQWVGALHAWFDRQLAQRDVDTGPAVELFLNDGLTVAQAIPRHEKVVELGEWPAADGRTLQLYPGPGSTLADERPEAAGSASFAGGPQGFLNQANAPGVEWRTAPMTESVVLGGKPEFDLVASVTATQVHLIANLFDEAPGGQRRRISQFAINPLLRFSPATPFPVIPGQPMDLSPPGWDLAHELKPGHRLVLKVTTSDPDKAPTFPADPNVAVYWGPNGSALRLPVVDDVDILLDPLP